MFLKKTDIELANISKEPVYYVDCIYNGVDVNSDDILTISELKNFWGKDFNEPLIAIEKLKVSKDFINVYKKNTNTLKITLPNQISLIKFNATDQECYMFENYENIAYIEINIIGKCSKNEWLGKKFPQIIIEDYEITNMGKYLF